MLSQRRQKVAGREAHIQIATTNHKRIKIADKVDLSEIFQTNGTSRQLQYQKSFVNFPGKVNEGLSGY